MAEPTNVFSQLRPEWVVEDKNSNYDDDFWTIVNFYLLHSICDGQSWKGDNLQKTYLWKPHPWKPSGYLKNKIVKLIWGDEKPKLYVALKRSVFEVTIQGKNLDKNFYQDVNEQRAGYVIVSSGNNGNEIMSLFYHIRNCLAHGRYGLVSIDSKDYMIFMEDGKQKGDHFEVTARIAIRKSSLLKVRSLIIGGPYACN